MARTAVARGAAAAIKASVTRVIIVKNLECVRRQVRIELRTEYNLALSGLKNSELSPHHFFCMHGLGQI